MKSFYFLLVVLLSFAMITSACSDDDDSTSTECGSSAQACTTEDAVGGDDANTSDTNTESSEDTSSADTSADDTQGEADTTADTNTPPPALVATESYEHEVLYGWIVAGQPTEARLAEVIAEGGIIITLRTPGEDPFDEPAYVEAQGGTFIRYPTTSADYQSVDFREGLYDLYDTYFDAGDLVYIHCASSNRAGASWAFYQAERKGVDPEEAVAMGIDAGLSSLESTVRSILGI